MSLLELVIRTQISEAVGWTLIHSLWEGTIIAAVLAASLVSVRSPRNRYVIGCAALLVMLASFAVTLIHFLPERGSVVGTLIKMTLAPWRPLPDMSGSNSRFPGFSTLIPWLA